MSRQMCRRDFLRLMAATGTGALAGCATGGAKQGRGARWYRGNLHMHTYWSDGRAFPEQAVSIYKQLGYDFIGLSDHNVFADQADCWRTVEDHPKGWPPQVGRPLFDAYSKAFGSEAETRTFEGKTQVRLKTYGEMRSRFEEPGKFLLMPAVEITQYLKEEGVQVHMNYVNLPDVIPFVKGGPLSRPVDEPGVGVTELIRRDAGEVKALAALGNTCFRLGAQTDFLLFRATGERGSLVPNPEAIEELYTGLREAAPNLRVLHLDNINPATIADYPAESARALKIIATYNTPGDTAAFGLESADPRVLQANNIGTDPDKTLRAIEIMNEAGGWRQGGIPKLLPGLNFLQGLKGENRRTMDLNLEFLRQVRDRGLLLRRINIRQVNPLGSYKVQKDPASAYRLQKFKDTVNKEINKPMLEKVFPRGTLYREVVVEESEGLTAYGRQPGTYPILVGIPGKFTPGTSLDVKIVGHGYRSITGLPWPLKIHEASLEQLAALPGIGLNRAKKIFLAREVDSLEKLQRLLPDANLRGLEDYLGFTPK